MSSAEMGFKNSSRAGQGGLVVPYLTDHRSLQVGNRQKSLYEATKEGRVFHGGMAAAGAVLPIFSNTAQKVGLWNPSGSGVNLVLTQVAGTYVSTTMAAGGFVLAAVTGTGAGLGASITAFTDGVVGTTIWNGLVSGGRTNAGRFTPSAATVTAPVIFRHLGQNQMVAPATDATTAAWQFRVDFDGDVIISPGNALFVAGNIATLVTYAIGMTWVEEDI